MAREWNIPLPFAQRYVFNRGKLVPKLLSMHSQTPLQVFPLLRCCFDCHTVDSVVVRDGGKREGRAAREGEREEGERGRGDEVF